MRDRLPPGAVEYLKRVRLRTLYRLHPRGRWGGLRRTRPFGHDWGRGGSIVDRYYIDTFLGAHADDIGGDVLEMGEPRYSRRFGDGRVGRCDTLGPDGSDPVTTVVGDLAQTDSLPEGRFDCFIMIQTLQYIPDPVVALENARRTLRPGGVLLLSVPCISRIDPAARWYPYGDLWRFTPSGLADVLHRVFPPDHVQVEGFGNVLAAVAFLMALGAVELRPEELELKDPDFPLVACARARKPSIVEQSGGGR